MKAGGKTGKDCQARVTEGMMQPITKRDTREARALWGRGAESSALGWAQSCLGTGGESADGEVGWRRRRAGQTLEGQPQAGRWTGLTSGKERRGKPGELGAGAAVPGAVQEAGEGGPGAGC